MKIPPVGGEKRLKSLPLRQGGRENSFELIENKKYYCIIVLEIIGGKYNNDLKLTAESSSSAT